MDTIPINTDADYREALKEIEKLMDAQMGSPEGEKLDLLVTQVEVYERAIYLRSCGLFSDDATTTQS